MIAGFTEARRAARMSLQEVSELFDISLRTVKRYHASGKAPKSLIYSLLMTGGWCPPFSIRNDFSGWSFGQGFLWSPEGDKFTSGDVRAGKVALLEMNRIHRKEVNLRQSLKVHQSNIIPFPNVAKKA